MYKMNSRNGWVSLPYALIATIAIFIWFRAVLQRAEERSFGRVTLCEIRSRLRDLTLVSLLPGDSSISISHQKSYTRQGGIRRFWDADCSDRAGNCACHLRWDADTGELVTLSRKAATPSVGVADVTRRDAISLTCRLLRLRGIGIPGERWTLSNAPLVRGNVWHINVKSLNRMAYLSIDKHTDQVLYLHITARLD